MGEEKWQTLSLKMSEEAFARLKTYAETKGQSVSDVVRRAIDELISGEEVPSPRPPASSAPTEIPEELRRDLEALAGREEETRRYVEGVAWRLNEVQATVNRIMGLMAPHLPPPPPVPFPGVPAPPWVALTSEPVAEAGAEGSPGGAS